MVKLNTLLGLEDSQKRKEFLDYLKNSPEYKDSVERHIATNFGMILCYGDVGIFNVLNRMEELVKNSGEEVGVEIRKDFEKLLTENFSEPNLLNSIKTPEITRILDELNKYQRELVYASAGTMGLSPDRTKEIEESVKEYSK